MKYLFCLADFVVKHNFRLIYVTFFNKKNLISSANVYRRTEGETYGSHESNT